MKQLLMLMVCVSLLAAPLAVAGQDSDVLYEVSTLDNLLAGQFDGQTSLAEVLAHGGFGIGTFHALDGEMVVLSGRVYQILSSGQVLEITDRSVRLPFALVAAQAGSRKNVIAKPLTYPELQAYLDTLRSPSRPTLFLIHGRFASMKTRSVPSQHKPYPTLAAVVARQSIFNLQDVTGTLVGVWSPNGLKPFTGSGYHFHFISDDRKTGGHVLELQLTQAEMTAQAALRLEVALPDAWPEAQTNSAAADAGVQEP